MKFALAILAVGAVLVKDALSASAEANSVPLLRKFSRNKGDASAEVESRGFFSINKLTKRPNNANVIFVTSPSGPSDSEESAPSTPPAEPSAPSEPSWPSWPSWPYWPLHTTQKPTTTTTPKPETKPPHLPPHLPPGDYPHYLPFPPPLLLPIPGWTGNPPPPFIHPSSQHRPQQQWPEWPEPPSWTPVEPSTDDQSPSVYGTPTFAIDDEIVNRDESQDEDKTQSGLLWVPLQQDFSVNGLSPEDLASLIGAKPQANKKPRPNRRRPVAPSPFGDASNNRKPRPTRRKGPVRKLPVESPANGQLPQMQPDNRRKPKPSRKPKPKPIGKPVLVTAKPEAAIAAEVPSEIPNSTVAAMPPAVVSTESPTRKKKPPSRKPRPSRKPKPATQAPAIVESMSGTEIGPVGEDKVEGEQPLQKEPQPAPMPEPISVGEPEKSELLPVTQMTGDMDQAVAAKPEPEDDELNSTEFLGPDEDLIVVQRQDTSMDAQRVESGQIPPWQLLKLPRDVDWELGPQPRRDSPKYFFDG